MDEGPIIGGGAILWDDCFLDRIEKANGGYRFIGEFHLLSQHPQWRPAKQDEWACYHKGVLIVGGVENAAFLEFSVSGWKAFKYQLPIMWDESACPVIDFVKFDEGSFILEATDIKFECHAKDVWLKLAASEP